jgi:FkbM family methyltransferase
MLPPRLRATAWCRLYWPTKERYHGLFDDAPLHFAPNVRMRLVPGDAISDSIAFTGIYDLPLTRMLLGLAREGGQLIDVGANLGYFSLIWAAANPQNSVIAFEPSPRNQDLLNQNVERNNFGQRIEVRSEAVGKEHGQMPFDPGPKKQTGWGGLTLESSDDSQLVNVVPLDDALLNVGQIALLKIDIEGADTWALLGAERLLRGHRIQHIWWEQHQTRMARLGIPNDEAAEFLRGLGYHPEPQGDPKAEMVNWYARLN